MILDPREARKFGWSGILFVKHLTDSTQRDEAKAGHQRQFTKWWWGMKAVFTP